jgi:hypothetical protein
MKKRAVFIGVTGHRILAEIDKIMAGIDQALEHLARSYPGKKFKILSPLAEGADRVVAKQAMARLAADLIATLPLEREDYATDFVSPVSKAEFASLLEKAEQVVTLPPAATRQLAYEALGIYLLDHCDVLIAVWDGQRGQGLGGTGEVVAVACRRGLPVVWVHAGNRRPGTLEPTSLGEDQGRLDLAYFSA